MSLRRNVRYRIKTYPSGRRVKEAYIGDRVVETIPMPKVKQTKSRRGLAKRRRRL